MSESNSGLRQFYIFAGVCAFLAMGTNLLDIILGFGSGETYTYGSKSAHDWFLVFNANPFNGLYTLGIFNLAYMLFMLPIYLGIFLVHNKTHFISSAAALIIFSIAAGIYFSSNAAVPMYVLANKFTAAGTETQKTVFEAAGEGVLSRGEDFTPGSFIGLFLSGFAAIIISFIMLGGGKFSRVNSWAGITGFSFLSIFTFIATFIPQWYSFAFSFFGGIGGLLALSWFVMTGVRFIKISAMMRTQ